MKQEVKRSAQAEYVDRQRRRKQMVKTARILLLVLVLILWEVSARAGWINDFIFSSPSRIITCFWTMVLDRTIFYHMGITVLETLISFALVI
ncbi:MAG: ABC transporter permease, partial [Lachnospiraceae bacterium]|nr:ABC transporter permease [Lachnospiraceae bacterium]